MAGYFSSNKETRIKEKMIDDIANDIRDLRDSLDFLKKQQVPLEDAIYFKEKMLEQVKKID